MTLTVALILGIEMRSGTNYLYDLLGHHTGIACAKHIPEDFLVSESSYLNKYVSILWSLWDKSRCADITLNWLQLKAEKLIHDILCNNGLSSQADITTVISKTPCVLGLEVLPSLFPTTKILILVRDGRSVAYSLQKSFDVSFFSALMRWQAGALGILSFKEKFPQYFLDNCLLIRYEDLYSSPDSELHRIFAFLGIDDKGYNYDYARSSHIIGSSDLRRSYAEVNWAAVPRTKGFNPLQRYTSWPKYKQKSAVAILHHELMAFGYLQNPPKSGFFNFCYLAVFFVYKGVKAISARRLKKRIKQRWLT